MQRAFRDAEKSIVAPEPIVFIPSLVRLQATPVKVEEECLNKPIQPAPRDAAVRQQESRELHSHWRTSSVNHTGAHMTQQPPPATVLRKQDLPRRAVYRGRAARHSADGVSREYLEASMTSEENMDERMSVVEAV